MSNPRFEIFDGRNNQYYFRLKAGNGEIIGQSEGYTQKHSAKEGISSVKINSLLDSRFEIFEGQNNKFYFNLKGLNGQIILQSQGYTTRSGATNGKESVKTNASKATVIDITSTSLA